MLPTRQEAVYKHDSYSNQFIRGHLDICSSLTQVSGTLWCFLIVMQDFVLYLDSEETNTEHKLISTVSLSTYSLLFIHIFWIEPREVRRPMEWRKCIHSCWQSHWSAIRNWANLQCCLWGTKANHSVAPDSHWQPNTSTLHGVLQVSCTLPPVKSKPGSLNVLTDK